jgi:hypothetical protein
MAFKNQTPVQRRSKTRHPYNYVQQLDIPYNGVQRLENLYNDAQQVAKRIMTVNKWTPYIKFKEQTSRTTTFKTWLSEKDVQQLDTLYDDGQKLDILHNDVKKPDTP